MTLTGVSNAVGGTVSNDATNVYFTPAADFNGAASFQYTVTDNGTTNGAPDPKSDTATVSFTITEANDAPVAENDEVADVAEDSGDRTIPFAVLTANDSKGPANESGQTLVVKTVSNAAWEVELLQWRSVPGRDGEVIHPVTGVSLSLRPSMM